MAQNGYFVVADYHDYAPQMEVDYMYSIDTKHCEGDCNEDLSVQLHLLIGLCWAIKCSVQMVCDIIFNWALVFFLSISLIFDGE